MRPAKRRRRSSSAAVGFSPFLRRLSTLHPAPLKPPPETSTPRRHRQDNDLNLLSSSENEEEEVEEVEEEEEEEEAIVQVDFGFFDPKPEDFHGLKLLLGSFLDDRVWDLSGFVDLILQQTTVGTVVKSDDGDANGCEEEDGKKEETEEDGPYAVVSALNLARYAKQRCIEDVKEYVLGLCPENLKEELKSLLADRAKDVALLVCERFVNYPDQAVPPLYNGLFDEIEWATEDEPTQDLRDFFCFKFYLIVTTIYVNKLANKHKPVSNASESDSTVIYIKSEDEIFHKRSSLAFTFDLHCGHLVPPEMKGYKKMGLVMVVKSEEVPAIRQEINLLGS